MKKLNLSGSDITTSNMALGLMRIQDLDDGEIRTLVHTALDAGIDFMDHADVYRREVHQCERRFAEAMRLAPSERDKITIQTKAGIIRDGVPMHMDHSYDHLIAAVEGSLKALATDRIDVWLLHRPDALSQPEEVARAFEDLESTGKVRAFGVSNYTPSQLELLRCHVRQLLVVNQLQLSLTHAPSIAHGLVANMADEPESAGRDGGIIDYCRLHNITIQAWSPFQIGYDRYTSNTFLGSPDHQDLNGVIDRLAAKYCVPPIAVATAWITRHPALMQVILGTTKPERITQAASGSEIPLGRDEWYELYRAAGHRMP